jgi:uncharacterized SAM-binding protein YcdF (DUF218 family)
MFFSLSKTIGYLLMPSTLLIIATLLCLLWKPRFKWFIAGLYIVLYLLPVGDWASYAWEQRYKAELPAKADGIVILSAGIDPFATKEHGQVSLNGAAERATVLPSLIKKYPQARVVYSGGSGWLRRQDVREADAAKELFTQWNLPVEKMIFERDSRNTFENAEFSKKLAKPKKGETWLLVTSAVHMPRSVAIFEKLGWNVTAAPVDFTASENPPLPCFCFVGNLYKLDAFAHEMIGMGAYRLTGKI